MSGRIALVLPSLGAGGAERVAVTLAHGLLGRGHAIDMVLAQASGPLCDLLPPGVRIINLKSGRLRDTIRPLAGYIEDERPAALHVSMWPLTVHAVAARLLARRAARLVLVDHVHLSEEARTYGAARRRALRASVAVAYPRADARVAVSSGVADDLARLGRLRRRSVEVVHNPIPLAPPNPAVVPDWSGDGARVLYVGSLKPQKNVALLLAAFRRLTAEIPARLAIVGDGVLRSALAAEADRLGIAGQVCFAGFVVDPAGWYASADVLAVSSDYEGFCNVIVEALGHGLPVVSTDCPSGPAEILGDGRFGRLVPPGDAEALAAGLREALRAPADRTRLRARAAEFAPDRAVARYAELLLGPGS